MSQRNLSQSSSRKNTAPLSQIEDLDHLTGKVVRYILEKSRKKYAIRTANIKKYVLKNRNSDFKQVITNASIKLDNIFGYELRHIPGAQYFLVNKVANNEIVAVSQEESAEQTLLFLTLAFIFMCSESKENAVVKEDELWNFFLNLNIYREDRPIHPYFRNVKELISSKFVKQLYLHTSKSKETGNTFYEWGPRAEAEIKRRWVLQFVSKIYQNLPIQNWPAQYKAMKESERSAFNGETD